MTQNDWITRAERTNFEETSRYEEAVEYCKNLDQASPHIRYSIFGKSGEGREMPLLIISQKGYFTPDQAKKANVPVLLIFNGIHAGEIAGKEATFMLLRDLLINGKLPDLIQDSVLLVVPIYNVDGHERISPFNRISQNGPKEMGFRTNAQNLNLNRDWLKADAPETKAMLKLYSSWLPHFAIDNHVSDGGDYQYELSYIADDYPDMPAGLFDYFHKILKPGISKAMKDRKRVIAPYFEFIDGRDPSQGITSGPGTHRPRFSTGYGTHQNRFIVMTESHMLKTFRTRIEATYDFMVSTLETINSDPRALIEAVNSADHEAIKLGEKPGAKFPISVRLNKDKSEEVEFLGNEYSYYSSDVSGIEALKYGDKPRSFKIESYSRLEPDKYVTLPLGYVIPPQHDFVISRLEGHGIHYTKTTKDVTGKFETYRFSDVKFADQPFEGRHLVTFKTKPVSEEFTVREGACVVPLNQRTSRVILALLEPDAPDSLVAWGYFSAIFEEKEWAEFYLLEKLAEGMIQKDPDLKKRFDEKLRTDPELAKDPELRLRFFFENSPYKDPRRNLYPVLRINSAQQLKELTTK